MQKIYQKIASTVVALKNCEKSGNQDWLDKHKDTLYDIERQKLPHGSGIDSGCKINVDKSTDSKIVIDCSYHCMDENGYYAGWRDYQIIIKAHLAFGFTVDVRGKDYNGLKDYLADLFNHVMNEDV